jgi:vacuolar-type H+-ATPase subunit F/Vma7
MKFIHISPTGAVLFDSLVQKTPAFVKFYSEGCGHCKTMEGAWEKIKTEIKPYKDIDINVIAVNSKAIPNIKSKCAKNVNGFPTIIEVVPGGERGMEHTSQRTTKELMNTIKKIIKKNKKKNTAGRPVSSPHQVQQHSEISWDDSATPIVDFVGTQQPGSQPASPRRVLTPSSSFVPQRLSFQDEDVDDNLYTLEEISEHTQNQINRNNISSVGMSEITKKAKIWAQFPDNTSAEAAHPVDLSQDEEEELRRLSSYLRSLNDMPENIRNELAQARGIKKRKKRKTRRRRKKSRRRNKRGKYRQTKRKKRYSRIRI